MTVPKPTPPPRPRLSPEALVVNRRLLAREREIRERAATSRWRNDHEFKRIVALCDAAIAELLQLYPELVEVTS